ncbi:MAG: hypothetical protein HOP19_28665 [Acidobacteria bacterium]|nr:hypothetical protein [Acidobacteriota bacterium]
MKRRLNHLMMTLCALCALAMCSLAQAAGEWDAAMETPGGSTSPYKLKLTAEGEKLSGTIKSQRGEYPISGTLKGKEIKLMYALNYNDSVLPVLILGTLEGDAIKATTDINNGSFQGAWNAKRVSGATNAMAPAKSQSGSPAAGQWDIKMNTPQGERKFLGDFTIEGETLKGQLKNDPKAQQGLPVTGTAKGKEMSFSYSVKFQEMDMKITMTGTIDGDAVKGVVDFGGLAQDEWSGKRATAASAPAAAAPAAAAASANDLTGTWDGEVETSAGSGTPTLVLKQEGEKITGTYKGQLGEYPLTGTLKGDVFEFSFKVSGQVEGTVIYKGTVSGKTMKGTVDLAGVATGTLKATKK